MSYLTQFAAAAAGATVQTLTGDVGGAISPTANNINLLGGNVLTTTGAGSTITFDLDNGSNGQVLVGGGSDPAWATISSSDASITITGGANTLDLTVAGGTTLDVITDSGTATEVGGEIDILGGVNINTSAAGNVVTVNLDTFTAGSVIFSSGSALTQDNANFFWDDTNNRLGIGTTTPLDSLHIIDGMELDHVATEADDHALEIVCDAAGFGDVKALDIDFITGAISAGLSEDAILVNIDETSSTGGSVCGLQVVATAGSASACGMVTSVVVDPVHQFAGTLGDADTILNKAVDVTAALANGGAGAITAFVADNDTFTIGDAAKFGEIEVILTTPASGSGIAPTFEYSTGVGLWASFGPTDGTNGFRNTGEIAWDVADIGGWLVGTGSEFLIRITRTRNSLSTSPVLDEIQIAATTTYTWDKNGDLTIKGVNASTSATFGFLTQYTLPIAGAAGAIADLADGLGASGEVLTSGGAGAEPTWVVPAEGGIAWNEETGTSATMAIDNGYIANNAGLVTLTLPTTAAVGEVVRVAGKGAGGWKIAQNASEIIHFGTTDTTTGVGGSLASTETYDAVELVCIVANTEWVVISSLGNITIV